MEVVKKDRISPEKAVEILGRKGLKVNREQAHLILNFLYKLADITLAQHMGKPP